MPRRARKGVKRLALNGSSVMDAELTALAQHDGDIRQDGADELVFNPYNPRNREVSRSYVVALLKKYGAEPTVRNFELFRRAFVHRSYTKRPRLENATEGITVADRPEACLPLRSKSNERLEFLGDGVLESIVKHYLYRRFPKENEGFMTEKKIQLVRNEAIGRLAMTLGLHRWLIISRHAEERNTRTNLKKLGCLFEAFLGALFLDGNTKGAGSAPARAFVTGYARVQAFVEKVLEEHVDWVELVQNDDNYKNILQVMVQKEFKVTPTYLESGFTEEDGFTMHVCLYIGDAAHALVASEASPLSAYGSFATMQDALGTRDTLFVELGRSRHRIKKKAEQEACRRAIVALGGRGGPSGDNNVATE